MGGPGRNTPDYRDMVDDVVHKAVSTYGTDFSGANARSIVCLTIYLYEKKRRDFLLQQRPEGV